MKSRSRIPGLFGWLFAAMLALAAGCSKDPENADSGTFTDNRDGREYQWVRIGTQVWMAENLAWLPDVSPPSEGSSEQPLHYVFRFMGSSVESARKWDFYESFGVFYNWPAAMNGADSSNRVPSGVRGACPEGWHLPSDAEWEILVNFLGGQYAAGKPLKSVRGWNEFEDNPGKGSNESGFNAIAAGARHTSEGFYQLGFNAFFWSSTANDDFSAWYRYLGYFHNGVYRYYCNKGYGFAIRCVKD